MFSRDVCLCLYLISLLSHWQIDCISALLLGHGTYHESCLLVCGKEMKRYVVHTAPFNTHEPDHFAGGVGCKCKPIAGPGCQQ